MQALGVMVVQCQEVTDAARARPSKKEFVMEWYHRQRSKEEEKSPSQ